jgi:diaminopimelate epimerase
MQFRKIHSLGDDCVLIDARGRANPITPAAARLLGDRHRGIGFNQLGVMLDCEDAAAELLFWNPDGSPLGACGTATRAAADLMMNETGLQAVVFRTARGLLACKRTSAGEIQVDMGAPLTGWTDIPLSRPVDTLNLPIDGAPVATSMGNPHCTFFVDDVDAVDLARRGPEIECHPLFPQRTNVHFVQVLDRSNIRLRIWERFGSIIAASGSCACAAAAAGIRRGLLDHDVTVHCDGGPVSITWPGTGGVLMTGTITRVFSGVLEPRMLDQAAEARFQTSLDASILEGR